MQTIFMRFFGVNYNVGLGNETWTQLSYDNLKQAMQLLKNMNVNYVKINGNSLEKMRPVAEAAADFGLGVWIAPRFANVTPQKHLKLIGPFAEYAEELRKNKKSHIVFCIANEASLYINGLLPGKDLFERLQNMRSYSKLLLMPEKEFSAFPKIYKAAISYKEKCDDKLNDFLGKLVQEVKKNFKGDITYSKGYWEKVKWSKFDIVSMNLYLSQWNRGKMEEILKNELKSTGKPCVLTEFGTACFKGASDLGVDASLHLREQPNIQYDEDVQIVGLTEQLKAINKAVVDGCFVWQLVEPDARGFGIARVLQDGKIDPKRSAGIVSEYYSNWAHSSR